MIISCTCETCKDMCKRRPCWPMPEDTKKIIEAGYGDKLMSDYWTQGDGDIYIISPAIVGYENRMAPFWPTGRCVFLDENDLCTLHDLGLKPTEGKEALCGDRTPEGLHEQIAMTWNNEDAQKLASEWRSSRG